MSVITISPSFLSWARDVCLHHSSKTALRTVCSDSLCQIQVCEFSVLILHGLISSSDPAGKFFHLEIVSFQYSVISRAFCSAGHSSSVPLVGCPASVPPLMLECWDSVLCLLFSTHVHALGDLIQRHGPTFLLCAEDSQTSTFSPDLSSELWNL